MHKKRYKLDVNRYNYTTNSKTLSKNKKGQVTIFIILGIIMLLAVALIIAMQKELVTFEKKEVLPTEKGQVQSFITKCIEDVGDEALTRLGIQGGYITVPASIEKEVNQHLKLSDFLMVPYWLTGPNLRIPSIDDMKFQIDNYVEDNLPVCLFELEDFQQSYDIIEKDQIKADTEIVKGKVIFNVNWNVEVRNKAGETVAELLQHTFESPVKLKNIHDLAIRIVEHELESLKLEDLTQDLIALEHPTLPLSGFDVSCSTKTWEVGKVQETLKDLLRVNVRELRVDGTQYEKFPEDLPYYQNHYIWEVGKVDEPDLTPVFSFTENYPFNFAVTPLSGSYMKSSGLGGSEVLSFFCLQQWKFTYDISYPVLLTIRDEPSGYTFNVAFTVHLVRNLPNRGEIVARPSMIIPEKTSEKFCQDKNILMTVKTYEKVQNNEGVDYRDDLGAVNLSYTCLRYKCDLPGTEYDYIGQGFAGITTNFPYCVGGILRGFKEGYKENWERVVTEDGKEVELELTPEFTIPVERVTVLKHIYNSPGDIGPARPLDNDESAIVKITYRRNNDLPNQPFHESTFTYPITDEISDADFSLLAKADFTYDLEVTVLGEEAINGGYKGNWSVSWDELQNADELIFHVITQEKKDDLETAMFYIGLQNFSSYVATPEIR